MFFRPINEGMTRWIIWPSVSRVSMALPLRPCKSKRVPLVTAMRSRSLKAW